MKSNRILLILFLLLVTFIGGCSSTDTFKEDYLPIEKTILANKSSWYINESLYEVPVSALEGVQGSELYRFQNTLLCAYYMYDDTLKESFYYLDLISIEDGERLYQTKLSKMGVPEIQIVEDYIILKDLNKKSAHIFDATLNCVNEYTFESMYFGFNFDCSKVYVFTNTGIEVIDLKSGNKTTILNEARTISLQKTDNNYITFTYIDVNTLRKMGGVLHLASGEVEVFPLDESPRVVDFSEDTWLIELHGDTNKYVVGNVDGFDEFSLENVDSVSLLSDSNHILSKAHNEEYQPVLTVYDIEGNYISSVELVETMNPLTYEMVWLEEYGGYLFTLMSQEDTMDRLLFWDLSVESDGKSLSMKDLESVEGIPIENAVSLELYERAKEIEDKYGVDVLIADQCDTSFPSHSADLLVSEEDIVIALNTLKATLETYPEGFFDQLKHDSYSEIEIQLVGTLEKDSSTKDVTYISGGLVYTDESKLVMALDARGTFSEINEPLQQTIYHEFSHMIDRKLEFRSKYYEDSVYFEDGWNSLNPEGFVYNEGYYGVLDPKYVDYFIDPYACSNGTEDRARIMEYAAMGKQDVFKREGIMSKLEYYCKSIRDGFDTTNWPEKTIWEVVLN